MVSDEMVDKLEAEIRRFRRLGPDPATWPRWNGGWPRADLALVDAVLSTRQPYSRTLAQVERWRDLIGDFGESELVVFLDTLPEELVEVLGHRRLPGTRTPRREGIVKLAMILMQKPFGFRRAEHIRAAIQTPDDALRVRTAMESVKGVGPATSSYFLMLVGVDGVKADTIVTRFVADAVGRNLPATEVEHLVREAADRFGVSAQTLDYAIWDTAPRRFPRRR